VRVEVRLIDEKLEELIRLRLDEACKPKVGWRSLKVKIERRNLRRLVESLGKTSLE